MWFTHLNALWFNLCIVIYLFIYYLFIYLFIYLFSRMCYSLIWVEIKFMMTMMLMMTMMMMMMQNAFYAAVLRLKRENEISALPRLDWENLISTPGANSSIYGICFRFLSYVLIIGLEEAKEILGAVIWHYCLKKNWSIFIGNRTAVQYKWALFTPDPVINSSSATECFNLCYRDTVSMACTHDWPAVS